MKVLKFNLSTDIIGVAEIDDSEVILYLEKRTKKFFGLIDWETRCTHFSVFTLAEVEGKRGVQIERMIHGYLGRYDLNCVNIDTFNIEHELKIIYENYLLAAQRQAYWDNRITQFVNNQK